jgi:hypothetical protein
MMIERNRTTDQLTTADFADRTPVPEQSEISSWQQESEQYPRGDRRFEELTATPALVRDEALDVSSSDYRAQDKNPATVTPLFSENEIGDMRSRWNNIQAEFVDEPRQSVQQADQLVATAMQRLAEGFARERASLEQQWDSGDSVSTEDLRVALQRYRAFFGRLLNAA